METIIRATAELFARCRIQFGDKQQDSAQFLAASQAQMYQQLFEALAKVPFRKGKTSGHVGLDPRSHELIEWIKAKVPEELRINTGSPLTVTNQFPLIEPRALRDFVDLIRRPETSSQVEAIQVAPFVLSALLLESSVGDFQMSDLSQMQQLRLQKNVASYIFIKESGGGLLGQQIQQETAALRGLLENYRAEFEHERAAQREHLDTLNIAAMDIEDKTTATETQLANTHETLINFETSVREELRLDRSRETWTKRYKEARNSFYLAAGLVVLALFGTIWVALEYGLLIIQALNGNGLMALLSGGSVGVSVAQQVSKLVVFSVPIVVYLWSLRALMRFFMRSMLLMDDARQRETMLDTYFLLVEQGRADVQDRPLILWALFRQAPGHGPDGIEPPDFTEVINAGLNNAGIKKATS